MATKKPLPKKNSDMLLKQGIPSAPVKKGSRKTGKNEAGSTFLQNEGKKTGGK